MDAEGLEISSVGEGPEIAERAAGAQPDRSFDRIAGHEVEAGPRPPAERHAQAEPAADRSRLAFRGDGPDIEEEDVPVGLAARRPVQAAGHVDIPVGLEDVKGIGPVAAVMNGKAGGAQGGDRDDGQQGGRPIGAEGEERPRRGGQEERGRAGRGGRKEERFGRGDAEAEPGCQEKERVGAGP